MADRRVLVVDDEMIIREVLTRYLLREGFAVDAAADGEEALEIFKNGKHALVLLDVMMPKMDGIEVLKWIRNMGTTPVIMLTAKSAESDRIGGLELGADDYVVKPFSPGEVIARVRAVLRRTGDLNGDSEGPLDFGDVIIDRRSRQVTKSDVPVELTPKEFDLLHFLASAPQQVYSRISLLEELWDFAFEGDPATVTVHIRRLREKIEADPSSPRHLITVWGAGYRFDP